MSLHNLATQMAARGRGPDHTLVHMSPKELQGLQALAMAHGGSLTINPETGLPEAGFLDNILPAIAGFALDAFAPGVGEAVGGMFGLGGEAGTALTVGGISGLASGSLEKGIMAGMGAYGGASIGESMIKGGTNSLTPTNNSEYGGYGSRDAGGDTSPMSTADRLGALKAGASSAFNSPKDFLKDNKLALAAISAPVLMDTFGNKTSIPAAQETKKYNMHYERDPITGALYDTSGEGVTYGGVGRSTRGMAAGGITDYDTRTDSQKALDYLMGKPGARNPMLFTHQGKTEAIKPADMETRKGGHYILDADTNTYVWVPDAVDTAGLAAAAAEKARLEANKGGPQGGSELGIGSNNPGGVNTNRGIVDSILSSAFVGRIANALGSKQAAAPVEDRTGVSTKGTQSISDMAEAEGFSLGPQATGFSTGKPGETAVGGTGVAPTGGRSIADMAESEGVALGPAATGNVGVGGGYGGNDGTGEGFGGIYARGGSVRPQNFYKNGKFNFHPAQVYADGGIAALAGGGLGNLGGYSDGGDIRDYSPMQMENMGSMHPKILQSEIDLAIQKNNIPRQKRLKQEMDLRSRLQNPQVYAGGGQTYQSGLGGYSDGGQLLKGPGDGVSDSIPARIAGNQPARLADGEFVIPARIVSELGNGSTDAGARQLYKMLDRIQSNRAKTVGKNKTAVNSKSARYLPA